MRENCKKQQKKSKKRQKEARGTEAIVKEGELNDFQLLCISVKFSPVNM